MTVVVQDVGAGILVRGGTTRKASAADEPLGTLCIADGYSTSHTIQREDRIRLILPDDEGAVGVADLLVAAGHGGIQRIGRRQLPAAVTRASKDLRGSDRIAQQVKRTAQSGGTGVRIV